MGPRLIIYKTYNNATARHQKVPRESRPSYDSPPRFR